MNDLKLTELLDTEILQDIQNSICRFTDIAAVIVDKSGERVIKECNYSEFCSGIMSGKSGFFKCMKCIKNNSEVSGEFGKPVIFDCYAGLSGFAVPIMLKGKFMGSIVGGQVRTEDFNEEKFRAAAGEFGISPEDCKEAIEKIKYMPKGQLKKTAEFLYDMAKGILNMMYNNHRAVTNSLKSERAARSRTTFLTGLTEDLRSVAENWIYAILEASEKVRDNAELYSELTMLSAKGREVCRAIGDTTEYMRAAKANMDFSECRYSVKRLVSDAVTVIEKSTGCGMTVELDDSLPENFIGSSGGIEHTLNHLLHYCIRHSDGNGNISVRAYSQKELYSVNLIVRVSASVSTNFSETEGVEGFAQNKVGYDFMLIPMLVRQMSGTIEVALKENGVTEFTLILPQLAVEEL